MNTHTIPHITQSMRENPTIALWVIIRLQDCTTFKFEIFDWYHWMTSDIYTHLDQKMVFLRAETICVTSPVIHATFNMIQSMPYSYSNANAIQYFSEDCSNMLQVRIVNDVGANDDPIMEILFIIIGKRTLDP